MRTLVVSLIAAALAFGAAVNLGKPLALKEPMSIQKLTSAPEQYLNKTVQVKGKVADVCQMMGCWMELVEAGTAARVRIKVEDGVIVFPKDSVGKTAVAEGVFTRLQMTREQAIEQAKHEAEMNKRTLEPSGIKGAVTIYQIQGTGAVVTD
jgi:hypothetical protein